ncbi:MAG: class I fructose-bisphosphate aldolase [Myxococcota bacterium]|nr:class I fructose-bisphosphate aldolase [Myxococcota bacterium]
MPVTDRLRQIMSWYASEPAGVRANLYRMLNTGRLAGTGKLVILPVDQGCEHGPARSFAKNPGGYDPHYHYQLAIDSGCNAYAAPLGFIEAGAHEYAGQIPTILKVNNNNSLLGSPNPDSAVTASVDDALRLGCSAIGFTVYPGSIHARGMFEELREITREAKAKGLAVVVWSYPRGEQLSKQGETAVDVISYAAQLAAQMGANIVKVKPPTAHLEQEAARKVYQSTERPIETLADRVRDVVQSTFNGRRIVIFSGGAAKGTEDVLAEIRQIAAGGGFGSIMGRNAFQRPKDEAIALLHAVMDIHADGGS